MAEHALRGGSDRSRDEHFVGRDRELSVLHAQLGHACEGRSGLVVLEGPAGIGKTALAGEFLSVVENVVVLEVSGDEGESELPYGMLGQIEAQVASMPEALAGSVQGAQAGSVSEARAGRVPGGLTGCVPEALAGLERRLPDPLVAGAALLELLGRLQHRAPVVLAVDGADWADLLSLQALKYRARAAA